MDIILTARNISIVGRLRVLKCYIWSTLLYGCETWTISGDMITKLEAMETWFYRRMLRISWKEKVTNVEVYRRMNTSTSLLIDIVHRQLTFLGHILRKGELGKPCCNWICRWQTRYGTEARNFFHLPQQDCSQITIGADKLGEEESCLDEVLCT